jgi:hypothetical protein
MRPSQRPLSILLLLAGWALAWGAGVFVLLLQETAPGQAGTPAEHWPGDTRVPLDAKRPTLVMLAHPRCPCGRASMDELAHLLARCQGQVAVHVLFYRPADASKQWARTDLWESAAAIPSVRVCSDPDGDEAKRFGAMTSGHVVMYAPEGQRLYSGGITGSRGQAGENAGRVALLALLNGGKPDASTFPVFGCALFPASECNGKECSCQN